MNLRVYCRVRAEATNKEGAVWKSSIQGGVSLSHHTVLSLSVTLRRFRPQGLSCLDGRYVLRVHRDSHSLANSRSSRARKHASPAKDKSNRWLCVNICMAVFQPHRILLRAATAVVRGVLTPGTRCGMASREDGQSASKQNHQVPNPHHVFAPVSNI